MNWVIAAIFSLVVLFAWGAVCYVFFQIRYDQSDDGRRRFLEGHYRYLTHRAFKGDRTEITPETLRAAGNRGWNMIGLPITALSFGMAPWNVFLCTGLLYFGGLFFASSWYGRRCLQLLKLASYSKGRPGKAMVESPAS